MPGHHPSASGAPEPRTAGDPVGEGAKDAPKGSGSAARGPKEPPEGGAPRDLAERVAAFVRHRFPLVVQRELGGDDSLLDSGVVDSMGIWDIVAFFEEELGLRMEDHDLIPENFDSITALVKLARAKQG